jgi:hypothetical protein
MGFRPTPVRATAEQAIRILGRCAHRDAIEFVEPNNLNDPTQIPNDPHRGDQNAPHKLGQTGGMADANGYGFVDDVRG